MSVDGKTKFSFFVHHSNRRRRPCPIVIHSLSTINFLLGAFFSGKSRSIHTEDLGNEMCLRNCLERHLPSMAFLKCLLSGDKVQPDAVGKLLKSVCGVNVCVRAVSNSYTLYYGSSNASRTPNITKCWYVMLWHNRCRCEIRAIRIWDMCAL